MTTENKHTPGPWPIKKTGDGKRILVGIGLVEGPNGYDVAEVYSDDCDRDEALANARLIAAAPDLLEALEWIIRNQCAHIENVRAVARDAIAKARGK